MTNTSKALLWTKESLRFATELALVCTLVGGGCTCQWRSEKTVPPPWPAVAADSALAPGPAGFRMNSLLADAARWFAQRRYSCVTNAVGGELRLTGWFVSPRRTNSAYLCYFTANQDNELLTLTATTEDVVASVGTGGIASLLVFNSVQRWGHYGIDPDDEKLTFIISVFHSDGHVKPEEMDRILEEAIGAMDSGMELVAPPRKDPENEGPEPPPNETAFQRLLQKEIRGYAGSEEEVAAEVRDLFHFLGES